MKAFSFLFLVSCFWFLVLFARTKKKELEIKNEKTKPRNEEPKTRNRKQETRNKKPETHPLAFIALLTIYLFLPPHLFAKQPSPLPPGALDTLETINIKDADLRDIFRGIAQQYDLNIAVDNAIEQRATVRLTKLPVIEALEFLCEEHDLLLSRKGHIFRIYAAEPEAPPPPVIDVLMADSLLSVDLQGEELDDVVRALMKASGENIMIRQGVRGPVKGALTGVPFDTGFRLLMENNGFSVRERDSIYRIDRLGTPAEDGSPARSFWVQVEDSLVTLDVAGAPISDLLRELAAQLEVNIVTYQAPEGQITARVNNLTLDATLNYLFKGTNITYRKEGDVYVVGSKQTSGIASMRLIRLDHIRADAAIELVPESMQEEALIQVVKEHNGLMVTGTNDVIVELEAFVEELDYPTPQILIEALVVDFTETDLFNLGIEFGKDAEMAGGFRDGNYSFNNDGLRANGDGPRLSDYLTPFGDMLGIRNIGRLPEDFYFKINALAKDGKANIRSRPQISTLNGHPASISIGTTQYYILETNTPLQSPSNYYLQETQRFETIEANVRLEVVPWVSASGEVTAEIRPEFSTPVGNFDPEVPPTINSRLLDSTVRLQDGETIILGGLIQEEETVNYTKVPILGHIPLLGQLFRSRSHETRKAELVIFITPHVFYGNEEEPLKWNQLRESLNMPREDSGSILEKN